YFAYRHQQLSILATLILGASLLGFCILPTLFLHGAFVIPVVLLGRRRQWSANTLLACTVLAGVASFGIFIFLALGDIAERHHLRKQYAFESMETRVRVPKHRAPARPSKETEVHLMALEKGVGNESNGFRTLMLERLHQQNVRAFIDSPGFGVGRRIL